MGGYNFPGSNGHIDLMCLTGIALFLQIEIMNSHRLHLGWIPERIDLRQFVDDMKNPNHRQIDRTWERLKGGRKFGDCLITCGTLAMSEEEGRRAGLVPSHAYAVLRIEQVEGHRMLQLKNP
jgi:calpain-7